MSLSRAFPAIALATTLTLLIGCSESEIDETADISQSENLNTESLPEMPSLQGQLDEASGKFMESAPPEMLDAFSSGLEHVRKSGVLETALKEGDTAPDFSLEVKPSGNVKLGDLLSDGPVVVTFYRGGWCPYCSMELKAIRDAMPSIKAAGGVVVAIAPEVIDSALSAKQNNDLDFFVLSDPGNKVARDFGIVYRQADEVNQFFTGAYDLTKWNGDESWELPLPATYVIDSEGVIRYAFVDPDYKRRAEPSKIVDVLRGLQS